MNDEPIEQAEVNVFERIDTICREFRKQFRLGERPLIEDRLEQVPPHAKSNLFRNLVMAEIDCRRRAGENPTSDEYISRFPKFSREIRQAFYESTMMSIDASLATPRSAQPNPVVDRTVTMEIPAANRLGDYQLIHELGRGGFGVVYEAKHLQRKNHVALKTLPIGEYQQGVDEAERLHKFRREFRSLADTNHPNLVGMQSLEVDGSQWFFTMDLVRGDDFLGYVRPGNQLDESRLRSVLPQLALGIMALHGQRIIHRDLKPSNVLVDDDGKIIILDFGLIVELVQLADVTISAQSTRFAGTPLYAAPEQIFGKSTSASDWYALGVMLYQALSGERPFSGKTQEVFDQKRFEDPPSLLDRDDIPQDLAELAFQLMQREAAERPDALAIAKSLALQTDQQISASKLDSIADHSNASDQVLLGREEQLQELTHLCQGLFAERSPRAVFVTGRSGEGKSTLIEKFLSPHRLNEKITVLSGRCYDRESVPFKAIDSIIDALVAFLRGRKDDEILQFLPDDIRMLESLFPIVGRVDVIGNLPKTQISNLDSKQIRDRAFGALREMLVRIGARWPLLIFIDDLQWGDADSAEVFLRMFSPPNAPIAMFIGSYRSDEVDESPFMAEWQKREHANPALRRPKIHVGPLTQEQCQTLVVSRIGEDDESIRRRADELFESTGGNPYFLDQLIDCFDVDTGSFEPKPLKEVIAGKFQNLPEGAALLLDVIAVSGQALPIGEAMQAADQPPSAYSTITHMRSERLVRMIGSESQRLVDTYHDKIRETVVDQLADASRKKIHGELGEAIEQAEQIAFESLTDQSEVALAAPTSVPRVYDLAYHFDACGDQPQKALVYSLFAAEHAQQQFALDVAIENYERAQRNATEADDSIRFRIAKGMGESLLRAGHFDRAARELTNAIGFSDQTLDQAQIEALKAEVAYKSQSLTGAVAEYEQAMNRLGIFVPKSGIQLFAAFVAGTIVHLAHLVTPSAWFARRQKIDERQKLGFQIIYRANFPYHFRDTVRQLLCGLRGLNRSEITQSPVRRALGFVMYGCAITINLGWYSRGKKYMAKALESAIKSDDVSVQAEVMRLTGYAELAIGRLQESAENFRKTAEIFEFKTPDYWQRILSRMWLSANYFRQGQLGESIAIAREVFSAAVQAGQDRLGQMALDHWARATDGDLPFLELKSCLRPAPEDFTSTIQLLIAEAHWQLHQGHTESAIETAERAVNILKKNWTVNFWTTTSISTLARALRKHAESFDNNGGREAKRLHSRSLRVSRWAVRVSRFLKIDRPVSLREYCLALANQGRHKRAYSYARKSCDVAELQGARYEYAKSLRLCGQIGKQLGLAEADQHLAESETLLADFELQIREAVSNAD